MLRLSRLHKPKHELNGERIQRVLGLFSFHCMENRRNRCLLSDHHRSLVANCLILILVCKKAELKKNQQIVIFFLLQTWPRLICCIQYSRYLSTCPTCILTRGLSVVSLAWGPFLESPGNISGPKSNIQIEK